MGTAAKGSMEYASVIRKESRWAAGVSFTMRRLSLGGRIEMTRKIRELSGKMEFLQAGDAIQEKIEAALLASEVDRLYLDWGVVEIEGLAIDGQPATKETLISAGPAELCREIVEAIKAECGLNEEERKN